MDAGQPKGNVLFNECIFAVVASKELPSLQAAELHKTLEDHGGEVIEIRADASIDLNDVTHMISSTSDFLLYPAARDLMIPVVSPSWITQSLLRNKQAPMRPHTPDPKLIFSQINLSCADIPTGDKDAIIGAVLAMGGMELSSLTKQTTHVCALTMDHPKCQEALSKKLKCKVVLPHWFDDCLKLGKRIDERPYLLPDPEIFRVKSEEGMPFPSSVVMEGATSSRPEYLPTPTDTPRKRQLDVFKERTVMFAEDLQLGNRLRGIIEDLIEGGGGSVTTSVHKADIYVFASRAEKDVGNLSWLYHLITYNEWTSPFRKLLHYPLPKEGIPGFKDYRITLSNYGGDARVYLENLVVATGAEFTKSMKQENTHLITARKSSEKCTAAEEWNINMINHLWLEESYARCEAQKLTDPRYTHFPPRTNLGEVIGQTQMEPEVLRVKYFPRDPTPSPADSVPLRRPAMHDRDRNARLSESASKVERSKHEEPKASSEMEEDQAVDTAKISTRPKSRVSHGSTTTPIMNRRRSMGKENETPSSTGSRGAKDRAISKLQTLAPDIAEYERESKRKGAVWGGERAANRVEKEQAMLRSSSPVQPADAHESSDEEETRSAKRQKTAKHKNATSHKPAIEVRLLVTSYAGWLANPAKEDLDKRKLRDLGIHIVADPSTCTHMAAPTMVRTKKFLCGLAAAPTLVTTDFIDASLKSTEIPAVDGFLLKDKKNEDKFKLKLKDAVARAKQNKRQLLHRVVIYCTADIENGPDTFKAIVEANGGTLLIYRARGGPTIKPTKPEEDLGGPEPVYLLTSQKLEDRQLWPKFEEMAKTGNMIPKIVHAEWLLDTAMSQELKWNDEYLATKA